MAKTKVKQKAKAGRVVRVTPELMKLIETKRTGRESVSATLKRIINGEQKYYALPSDLCESLSEARGRAIMYKVQRKLKAVEKPIAVRELV